MDDRQASEIIKAEWPKLHNRPPSKLETLFMMAVAKLETGYGRLGQHGKLAEQGLYNWANIERAKSSFPGGECPDGWAAGVDWAEQIGGKKQVCFRVYRSDNEAANALIYQLTKRHWPVIKAIETEGTAEAVAHAMKMGFDGKYGTNGAYYEASEESYAKLLNSIIRQIGVGLQEDFVKVVQSIKKTEDINTGLAIIGLGLSAVGYFALQKK